MSIKTPSETFVAPVKEIAAVVRAAGPRMEAGAKLRKVAATPPTGCSVPTPDTIVPKALIGAGTNAPAAACPPAITAAVVTVAPAVMLSTRLRAEARGTFLYFRVMNATCDAEFISVKNVKRTADVLNCVLLTSRC